MRLTSLALAAALGPMLAAQGKDQPPAELQRYAPLVGTWHGSGTAAQGSGAPLEWTSVECCQWALGGRFLRQDSHIEIKGQDVPLQFTSFYGFDGERQRWVVYAMSNGGTIDHAEVFWDADGAMITAHIKPMGALVQVDRWVTKVKGDALTTAGWQATGAGAFVEHVKGTAKRTSKTPTGVRLRDATFANAEVAESKSRMERVMNLRGLYDFQGSMVPALGKEPVPVRGKLSAAPIFGGTVIELETTGDVTPENPGPAYESLAWIAWDLHDRCYKIAWVSNTGECGLADTRFAGDHTMITMEAGLRNGQPIASRHVTELDDAGRLARSYADSIVADGPTARVFECKYTAK